MMGRWERAAIASTAIVVSSCAPLTDEVFAPLELASDTPVVVDENAGVVAIPLRLARPRQQTLSLAYTLVGIDAQDDCQEPDFGAADGRVEWAPGALEAEVRVWIGDDDLAERDERFELRLEASDVPSVGLLGRIEIVIADDDRSALLDASELGVISGAAGDQSAALQAALDHAAARGRGVVVMAPGDYEISSVSLSPGTTLSGHDVRWHRPPQSEVDLVSLRVQHEGVEPSRPTLVEGLSIDGRREDQGPYRDHEREQAHLVQVAGDSAQGGALQLSLEGLTLGSGTGSGLFLGPDSDVTLCGLRASELWRDAVTLNGGGTRLRMRDLDATATQGTGLWLGAHEPGFGDSYRIDVEAEDVSIGAGDIEIEVTDSSQVTLRRLTMTDPPIRLDAPGGSVRIEDSVLALGSPSVRSPWALAHDVEVVRTTLVATGAVDATAGSQAPLDFAAVSLTPQSRSFGPATPGSGRLSFSDCRFVLAEEPRSGASAYAIANDSDAVVVVSASQLDSGFDGWFAPECRSCTVAP